jgi:chaperonin GroEL (HSP60 family)
MPAARCPAPTETTIAMPDTPSRCFATSFAEDVEGEALATLIVNKLSGSLQVAAVSVPGLINQRKSWLQDIALLTGGKAIMEGHDTQLKNIQISDLGQAKKVIIDKNRTVIESRAIYHQLRDSELLRALP